MLVEDDGSLLTLLMLELEQQEAQLEVGQVEQQRAEPQEEAEAAEEKEETPRHRQAAAVQPASPQAPT